MKFTLRRTLIFNHVLGLLRRRWNIECFRGHLVENDSFIAQLLLGRFLDFICVLALPSCCFLLFFFQAFLREFAVAQIFLLLLLYGPLLSLLNLFPEGERGSRRFEVQRGEPVVFDEAIVIVFVEACLACVLVVKCRVRAVGHTTRFFVVKPKHGLSRNTGALVVFHSVQLGDHIEQGVFEASCLDVSTRSLHAA